MWHPSRQKEELKKNSASPEAETPDEEQQLGRGEFIGRARCGSVASKRSHGSGRIVRRQRSLESGEVVKKVTKIIIKAKINVNFIQIRVQALGTNFQQIIDNRIQIMSISIIWELYFASIPSPNCKLQQYSWVVSCNPNKKNNSISTVINLIFIATSTKHASLTNSKPQRSETSDQ